LTLTYGIFVYLLIWWTMLFAVLPLGVKRPENPIPGTDPGAPDKPMLVKKAIITSLVSAVVWGAVYWLMASEYFRFRPY
jgi:predicted secreted protein